MSLTMMALRISAVQALKAGGTLVGGNVLDSEISAIDLTADGQLSIDREQPFIAVYTDAASATDLGQTGLRANGKVELVLNAGVSIQMAQTDRETGASMVAGVPATDSQFETVLDLIDVQITRSLTAPDSIWAQIFGDFILHYDRLDRRRSSNAIEATRLAVAQTKIMAEVLADPAPGQAVVEGSVWARFLAQAEADGLPQAPMIRLMLADGNPGAYAQFERLTSMTVRDAADLQLYSFGGVALDVAVSGDGGVAEE